MVKYQYIGHLSFYFQTKINRSDQKTYQEIFLHVVLPKCHVSFQYLQRFEWFADSVTNVDVQTEIFEIAKTDGKDTVKLRFTIVLLFVALLLCNRELFDSLGYLNYIIVYGNILSTPLNRDFELEFLTQIYLFPNFDSSIYH